MQRQHRKWTHKIENTKKNIIQNMELKIRFMTCNRTKEFMKNRIKKNRNARNVKSEEAKYD